MRLAGSLGCGKCRCLICRRNSGVRRSFEQRARRSRIRSEIVKPTNTEQRAIGAVDVFCIMLCCVMLEVSKNSAAIGQTRVADAGYFELCLGAQAPKVEGFEGRTRQE